MYSGPASRRKRRPGRRRGDLGGPGWRPRRACLRLGACTRCGDCKCKQSSHRVRDQHPVIIHDGRRPTAWAVGTSEALEAIAATRRTSNISGLRWTSACCPKLPFVVAAGPRRRSPLVTRERDLCARLSGGAVPTGSAFRRATRRDLPTVVANGFPPRTAATSARVGRARLVLTGFDNRASPDEPIVKLLFAAGVNRNSQPAVRGA